MEQGQKTSIKRWVMRGLVVVLAVISISAACEDLVELVPIDGEVCLRDFDGRLWLGEEASRRTCHLGTIFHNQQPDGSWSYVCVGSFPPTIEICEDDGRDQDCQDGPDNVPPIDPLENGNLCHITQQGVCKLSTTECVNGTLVCVPPPFYGPERCSDPEEGHAPFSEILHDENCNGLVDNDDSEMILGGPEFSYSGPIETLNVGLCRAGHRECIRGEELVVGEVLPSIEICTVPNGPPQDESCDGRIDETDKPEQPEAILFSFDTSGSMGQEIEASIETLCAAAAANYFPNSSISIQLVSLPIFRGQLLDPPYVIRLTDFVDFQTACTELEDWYVQEGLSGGSEYMPEGIRMAHMAGGPAFVNWPADARRRVILFTDEGPQPYPPTGLDGQELILNIGEICTTFGFSLGIFTDASVDQVWERYAVQCQGWVELLSDDPAEMRASIVDRLGAECVP